MTVQFDKIEHELATASVPFGDVSVRARPGLYRNYLKRCLDLALIIIASPVAVPFTLALAFLVALDGHNPFYWSRRVGRYGKTFRMLKLRTMVPEADDLLDHYLAENEEARREWDATQKLKRDPRVTWIGAFLRKTSLDELPQLWNVVVGDMSLVGPRPMFPVQRAQYPGMAYYALRPGITGSWQVNERNDCEFAKRAVYDREYDERISFAEDVRILAKTVGVVLSGTGY